MEMLGVLIQIWLVGLTVTIFSLLVFEAIQKHRASKRKEILHSPFLLFHGTLRKPK